MMRDILIIFLSVINCAQIFAQKEIITFSGFAQGTTYSISYYDDQQQNFQNDIEKILSDFNNSLSLYDSSSIVCRINRNEKNVKVDKYFKVCFEKAMEVSKNSDGAFDITVGPLVDVWGFGIKKKITVDSALIDSLKKFVGYKLVEIQGDSVVKKDSRVTLNFNAIAQGYSVDVISEFLESKKISDFIVEIGGEVYAKGKKQDSENWKVGIEKPLDNPTSANPLTAIVKLYNRAVSTSGNYRKFYIEDGKRYAHHIDPRTGYPERNNMLSASVFADKCITADAYATAFLVMGLEKAEIFLDQHPELMVYFIYSDDTGNYKTFESPGLKEILTENK